MTYFNVDVYYVVGRQRWGCAYWAGLLCMTVWHDGARLIFVCCCFMPQQLYFSHGSDMMYEMRRRKPGPTLLPTQGFFKFKLAHHIGML